MKLSFLRRWLARPQPVVSGRRPNKLRFDDCRLEDRICLSDTNPPYQPPGVAEVVQTSASSLDATWSASHDDEGPIASYEVAAGYEFGGTELQDYIDVGDVTTTTLNVFLTQGVAVWISVRAVDQAGNRSEPNGRDIVPNVTPPSTFNLFDGPNPFIDSDFTESINEITACWPGDLDAEWAVGTAPGGDDVRPFSNSGREYLAHYGASLVVDRGLSLSVGVRYYVSARYYDGSNVLRTDTSDGVLVLPNVVQGRLAVSTLTDVVDGNYADGELSLREAIQLANSCSGPNGINFRPGLTGTIHLTGGELPIDDNVTIYNADPRMIAIDADGASRIFNIAHARTATISGLTLRNGSAGSGGAIFNQGKLDLSQSVFENNTATDSAGGGGAIRSDGYSLTINFATFVGNSAAGDGGALFITSGANEAVNATFGRNSAGADGGAVAVAATAGSVQFTYFTVASNRANTRDGAFVGGGMSLAFPAMLIGVLVAGNHSGSAMLNDDIAGVVSPDNIYNLVADASSAGGMTNGVSSNIVGVGGVGTRALTTILEVESGVARLADNGGMTATVALVENSPAIAAMLAGYGGRFDQREVVRDLYGDIGAYEVNHPLAPVGVSHDNDRRFAPKPSASANEAYVKGLYQSTLLRNADPAGLVTWVTALEAGVPRDQVAYGFVNSTENRSNQVGFYYKYFLGRGPDPVGLATWVGQLQGGVDEATVMSGFLLSPEFTGQTSNEGFVSLMYFAVLGRGSDPSGFDDWVSRLNNGQVTRDQVGFGFLYSHEGITRVANAFVNSYLMRFDVVADVSSYVAQVEARTATFGRIAAQMLGSEELFNLASVNLNRYLRGTSDLPNP